MRFNENQNFDEKKYFEKLNKKFKEEEERENRIIMEMKNTDNYINWLETFTLKHPVINDSLVYNSGFTDIELNDIENISNLGIFFGMIDDYAKENYIYPEDEADEYYIIKHNNVYYLIEYDYMFGGSFRLLRVPNEKVNEINSYIEFKDVQTNKRQPNADVIKIQLASLANMIYEYSTRVPIKAIKEKIEDTILDIEENLGKEKVKKIGTK